MTEPPATEPPARARRRALGAGLLIGAATLALYARPLLWPMLTQDDFQVLAGSWTWERARANLWVPQNEHVMPLGRLWTHALVWLAGRPSALPAAAALAGPAALLAGLLLAYLFVRRELGHPLYGLLAAAVFGVTSVYQQGVWWFAASFSVLALDTLLLALLAAQAWRRTGRALYLDLAVAACALAPGWFASGLLAGPLCCLYLLPGEGDGPPPSSSPPAGRSFSFLPLLGTGLFLALSLPRAGQTIMHLEHYGGKTALESFDPLTGLVFTLRSVVDNLLLGLLGVSTVEVPPALVAVVWVGLAGVGAWWWVQAPRRRLLLLGLGVIFGGYLLPYSARAGWGYAGVMTQPAWGRYHLLPQLGLALFVCGGLPGRAGRWFAPGESLGARQARGLAVLVGVCFVVQLPRALVCYPAYDPGQKALLRRVEEVDARCREHGVSAEAAREALPKLDLGKWASDVNGWEFLRGSPHPRERSAAEVRRVLGVGERGAGRDLVAPLRRFP
jgi:hypothetical protein